MEAVDHSVLVHSQLVAEKSRPAQLFHQRSGKLTEGVADDDRLGEAAQLIQKLLRTGKRIDFLDGLLNFPQAEAVLTQNANSPVHQLAVIRFISCRPAQFRNAADFGKGDPDFRNQNAFQVKTNHIHCSFSP